MRLALVTDKYRAYITKVFDLKKNIANSLDFILWKEHLSHDSSVFIKPNFTFPYYKEGITTNPQVLRCLVELLKDNVAQVIIGESDGANHSFKTDQAFKGHGMYEMCKETGAELVNLSKIPSETVEGTIQGKSVKVLLPKMLLHDIDCFISVPVLKVHANTTVTLSMKNLWGCYPDTMRCLHHKDLSRKLALITKSLNPQLVIIDGTYALDGHGPMYGTPIKTDLILSANNPVVADSLGSAVMGIPLSKVDHISVAEKEGLGITDLSKVTINDDWKQYSRKFEVNKTVIDRLSWILFNSETCSKCVMDSPLTPLIYNVVGKLRNKDEKNVSDQIKKKKE
jgi:uncharacterized protein (DUF362 family)